MRNLICWVKGHRFIFVKEGTGGLFYRGKLQMRSKVYRCSRCGEIREGTSVTKRDSEQVMQFARIASAEQQHALSRLPIRVEALEKHFRR